MPKPPDLTPPPVVDVGDNEITIAYIEKWTARHKVPWVLTMQDELTTLKIALVHSWDVQLRGQRTVYFPVFTTSEFGFLMAVAARERRRGNRLDLRWFKRICKVRVEAQKLGLRLVHYETYDEDEIPRHAWEDETPAGWTSSSIAACVRCGRGVVLRDLDGRPYHPSCGGKRD